jgi:FtsP/CotA-like multicopper oxidase with cupredoxin domain
MRSLTAAPSGTLRPPLDRRGFISRMAGALAMIILPAGTLRHAIAASEGWTVLRVREGDISVNGKTSKVYSIQQADGASGYVGTKGHRLRIVLQNHTREPLAIHWHGIILPNGQDGVPYVTQPPIKPGAERRYDFPMHLHGHVFQVTEVGGRTLAGAIRDTVLVPPSRTVKVQFDAAYPGYWMMHCHLLYHQAGGMMMVVKYQGFEDASRLEG